MKTSGRGKSRSNLLAYFIIILLISAGISYRVASTKKPVEINKIEKPPEPKPEKKKPREALRIRCVNIPEGDTIVPAQNSASHPRQNRKPVKVKTANARQTRQAASRPRGENGTPPPWKATPKTRQSAEQGTLSVKLCPEPADFNVYLPGSLSPIKWAENLDFSCVAVLRKTSQAFCAVNFHRAGYGRFSILNTKRGLDSIAKSYSLEDGIALQNFGDNYKTDIFNFMKNRGDTLLKDTSSFILVFLPCRATAINIRNKRAGAANSIRLNIGETIQYASYDAACELRIDSIFAKRGRK